MEDTKYIDDPKHTIKDPEKVMVPIETKGIFPHTTSIGLTDIDCIMGLPELDRDSNILTFDWINENLRIIVEAKYMGKRGSNYEFNGQKKSLSSYIKDQYFGRIHQMEHNLIPWASPMSLFLVIKYYDEDIKNDKIKGADCSVIACSQISELTNGKMVYKEYDNPRDTNTLKYWMWRAIYATAALSGLSENYPIELYVPKDYIADFKKNIHIE